MMKKNNRIYIVLFLTWVITGCRSPLLIGKSTIDVQPTKSVTILATSTYLPTLFTTKTQTPVATLASEVANKTIKKLLQETSDCSAPCFWGIVPRKTTSEEAKKKFDYYGLKTVIISNKGKDYYNITHDVGDGLNVSATLPIQNNLVDSIRIYINPEKQKPGFTREWLAYSPETLINRYGTPSRVDFFADYGPGPFFTMQMYFDAEDLIVQYSSSEVILNKEGFARVCPLTLQFDTAWLWMGKNPQDPPGYGIPLEEATKITRDEFANIMTGDPKNACFTFNENVFR
jgi:hypothetical protein